VVPGSFTFLHTWTKQDAYAEDEMSKQHLQRHIREFANATHMYCAERTLQRDQIHFLNKINKEAKVCRSTKSIVLRTAKEISHENTEKARAKRAAKDAAKVKGEG
jgi:hypothetical protein